MCSSTSRVSPSPSSPHPFAAVTSLSPFHQPSVTFYPALRFFFISYRAVRPNRIRCYFFTCAVSAFSSSYRCDCPSLTVNGHREVVPSSSAGHLFRLGYIIHNAKVYTNADWEVSIKIEISGEREREKGREKKSGAEEHPLRKERHGENTQ